MIIEGDRSASPWNALDGPRVEKVIIVRAPDRGQLRGQITGAKSIRTLSYMSRKTRCAQFGELHPTPEDASAMIFASFDLIDGEPHRGEQCLMPLEALAAAIEAGRIGVPAGDAE